MYTSILITETRTENFKLRIEKQLPHDGSKANYVIRMDGVERVRVSNAEDVSIALVGVIESLVEKLTSLKAY